MTVAFMRNKVVQVEPAAPDELKVYWRLTDDLIDMEMKMSVSLPDLEITDAEACVKRSVHRDGIRAEVIIKKVIGVNIGPGLRKIVRGLLGGTSGNIDLTEGVLECCNAVILNFTLPAIRMGEGLKHLPLDEQIKMAGIMLKANPRLLRSCVAFSDDSPIVKALNAQEGV